MSARCRGCALVLALVAGLALGPGRAVATPGVDAADFFALNVQTLMRIGLDGSGKPDPGQWPTFLGAMSRAGIASARMDAPWDLVEPAAPSPAGVHAYVWDALDLWAGAFAAQGVRWKPILGNAPLWASSGPSQYNPPKPERYGDFAAFAQAFAARYGAGGAFWREHPELPALPVRLFEIWNEPNTGRSWAPAPAPDAYARLYALTRAAVHGADTGAVVEVGGVFASINPNDMRDEVWVRGFFDAGPGPVDAIGSHPYAPTAIGVVANLRRLHAALASRGQADLPVHVNELGWIGDLDGAGVVNSRPELTRAGTVAVVSDMLAASDCNVHDVVLYSAVEPEFGDPDAWQGLFRKTGLITPAGQAFADAAARYRATNPTQPQLALCGDASSASRPLLPLTVELRDDERPGCFSGEVAYRGMPVQEATLHWEAVPPTAGGAPLTNASGRATFCPPAGKVMLWGELAYFPTVPRFGLSKVSAIDTRGPQPVATQPPPGGGGPSAIPVPVLRLRVAHTLQLRQALRRGIRIRLRGVGGRAAAPASVRGTALVSSSAAARLGLPLRHGRRLRTVARGRLALAADAGILRLAFDRSDRRPLARSHAVTLVVRVRVRLAGSPTVRTLVAAVTLTR